MKALFYLEGCALAGSERVLQEIAEHGRHNGLDITIASCGALPSPVGEIWHERGACYDFHAADVSPQSRASISAPTSFDGWWRTLLADLQPDVLLANNGGYPWHITSLSAVRIANEVGIQRRILAIHSTPEAGEYDTVERMADRGVASSCDAIVIGSPRLASMFAVTRPELAGRLRSINYGVPDPGLGSTERDAGPVRFGMAANFRGKLKGQIVFMKSLLSMKPKDGAWEAIVAGDGPGLVDAMGLANGLPVKFLGCLPSESMPLFYRNIDVYVLPSLHEGLSLTVLDAMAHGLPVITTDVGGHADAVADGVTGLLVPPGDEKALCRSLTMLLADARLRRGMGVRGRARYLQKFTQDQYLHAWLNLLRGDA